MAHMCTFTCMHVIESVVSMPGWEEPASAKSPNTVKKGCRLCKPVEFIIKEVCEANNSERRVLFVCVHTHNNILRTTVISGLQRYHGSFVV